jgi:hypothetical protein
MSLPNVPAGWSAFRVLRQKSERVRPVRHGNWKHGARSKRALAEMRELRFLLRVADSPRFRARLPDCVLHRLPPLRPMGWRGYFTGRCNKSLATEPL